MGVLCNKKARIANLIDSVYDTVTVPSFKAAYGTKIK